MSSELVVAISDFALAGFSGLLAFKILSQKTDLNRIQRLFAVVLGSIAAGAAFGGITHGFVPETDGIVGGLVWRATLAAIGVAAFSLWMIASLLLFKPGAVERARWFGIIGLAIYVGVVLFQEQRFFVALSFYIPACLILLFGFAAQLRRQPFAMDGFIAMAVTFAAAALQYFQVGIHPVYFNHNALYHVGQGIALYFLYRAGRRWLETPGFSELKIKTQPLVAKIG